METIFVAGHRGMVGSAIVRRLQERGYARILTADRQTLDLLDQAAVRRFFDAHRIDQVYLAAAKVGGIHANNTYPAAYPDRGRCEIAQRLTKRVFARRYPAGTGL